MAVVRCAAGRGDDHFRPDVARCWSSCSPASRSSRWPGCLGGRPRGWPPGTGAGVGGLLNATFGNAAELIIALVALRAGCYDVVKASLTGSIIGNILLVLGAVDPRRRAAAREAAFDRSARARQVDAAGARGDRADRAGRLPLSSARPRRAAPASRTPSAW